MQEKMNLFDEVVDVRFFLRPSYIDHPLVSGWVAGILPARNDVPVQHRTSPWFNHIMMRKKRTQRQIEILNKYIVSPDFLIKKNPAS